MEINDTFFTKKGLIQKIRKKKKKKNLPKRYDCCRFNLANCYISMVISPLQKAVTEMQ